MMTPLEALVRELNSRNGVSLSAADLSLTYAFTDEVNQTAIGRLFGKSGGSLASVGDTAIRYHRTDLAAAFQNIPGPYVVNTGTSVYGILTSLRRNTGLLLTNADLVDAPINWVDNTATVTLTAVSGGQFWMGSVTIQLQLQAVSLSGVLVNPVVDVTDPVVTYNGLLAAAQIKSHAYVPFNAVTYSGPELLTGSPTTKNTRIKVTAVPGLGYVGSTYIYYDRKDLGTFLPMSELFVFDTVDSGYDLISYLIPTVGDVITPYDIKDTAIDYSTNPAHYVIESEPTSLTYYGNKPIDIRRRKDNKQTININLTADDVAYTPQKLLSAITSQMTSIPYADVVITVAAGVTIVGSQSTVATLVLGDVPGLQQIDYYLNNAGSVFGRGGNGGVASSGHTPGQSGGNAISVTSTTARIFIDNQGRICGGGGGGGYGNNSGRIGHSGGGVPLGVGTAGTATLTNPTNGTMGQEYPIATYGGNGGCVGCVGNQSYMQYTSNGQITNSNNGGAAGKVIIGQLDKVTWTKRGSHLPFLDDDIIPSFTATAYSKTPIYSFPDPVDSKRLIAYLGTYSDSNDNRGDYFLNGIGYTLGVNETAVTSGITYAVVYIDGNFRLYPLGYMSSGTMWDNIAAQDLGKGGVLWSTQGQRVRVRMMQGADVDPVPATSIGTPGTGTSTSEYDRVFLLLCSDAGTTTGYKWNLRTTAQLLTARNTGSTILVKEAMADGVSHASRGYGTVLQLSAIANGSNLTSNGLRPAMDWLGPVDISEYNRFLTWISQPGNVEVTLTSAQMANTPYAANNAVPFYGKLAVLPMTPTNSSMYGSPYKSLFADGAYWGDVFQHALPSRLAWINRGTRVCLALITAQPKQTMTGTTRNLVTSTTGDATRTNLYSLRMERFVYFEPALGKMMEYNPYLGTIPTEFIF